MCSASIDNTANNVPTYVYAIYICTKFDASHQLQSVRHGLFLDRYRTKGCSYVYRDCAITLAKLDTGMQLIGYVIDT